MAAARMSVSVREEGVRGGKWRLQDTGAGHGSPLQDSCPENSMDRGAWWAAVLGAAELDRTE